MALPLSESNEWGVHNTQTPHPLSKRGWGDIVGQRERDREKGEITKVAGCSRAVSARGYRFTWMHTMQQHLFGRLDLKHVLLGRAASLIT